MCADPGKGFIVCGQSAGANLAAAVALQARDDPSIKRKLSGQILIIPEVYSKSLHPLTQYSEELRSFEELGEVDPTYKSDFIKTYTGWYEGKASKEELSSYKRSPLLAESLAGLPPSLVLISGRDPLRDEGILFSRLLAQAIGDTRVRMHIYPGAYHGFHNAFPHTAAAKKLAKDLNDGVNWLLLGPT